MGLQVLAGTCSHFRSYHLGNQSRSPPPNLLGQVTGPRRLQDPSYSTVWLMHVQWEASCGATMSHSQLPLVKMPRTWRPMKNQPRRGEHLISGVCFFKGQQLQLAATYSSFSRYPLPLLLWPPRWLEQKFPPSPSTTFWDTSQVPGGCKTIHTAKRGS